MDIDADPHLLDGASALVSMGHDEYWTPAERANVTAARNSGVNLAFLGANAMFRRTRLQSSPLGAARQVVCYKSDYTGTRCTGCTAALVTSDWRDGPDPDPESSLIGTVYEGYPVNASFVVSSPRSWVFKGTGVASGDAFPNLVGVEYDRVDPAYPLQRPIEVLSHSPLTCNGVASYGDSAYYTHAGGAGVFNCGTMRWVEALYGDQPHGIGGATPDFVRAVTTNVLRAFADGPAAAKYPAHDNLAAIDEHVGSPIGAPSRTSSNEITARSVGAPTDRQITSRVQLVTQCAHRPMRHADPDESEVPHEFSPKPAGPQSVRRPGPGAHPRPGPLGGGPAGRAGVPGTTRAGGYQQARRLPADRRLPAVRRLRRRPPADVLPARRPGRLRRARSAARSRTRSPSAAGPPGPRSGGSSCSRSSPTRS